MQKTILLGGGTGLIGTALAHALAARGDEVRLLTRNPRLVKQFRAYHWDVEAGTIDAGALVGVTHIVNLAGAGIADGRWTPARKRLIVQSRTKTTQLLGDAILAHGKDVEAYISASAIGYYGNQGEQLVNEHNRAGDGFLSESTVAWEYAVGHLAGQTGLRTVALRTGIVLSPKGGALEAMLKPARFGLSGYFGDGQQWYSWIHLEDIVQVYIAAIDHAAYSGPINAVAPEPARNRTLAEVLAKAVHNPALAVPVPAIALKLALGEMSHTVLDSTRVSASKLTDELGFSFRYPELEPAMRQLLA